MAPKRRGSANTKATPSVEETSNQEAVQISQLAKMIQGYEEKNNATAEMMGEMKRMFEEKMQALEIENNILKEKAGKPVHSRTERNSMSHSRKTKNESEIKVTESSRRNSESSATSSSKTASSSKKTNENEEKSSAKQKEAEKKRVVNEIKMNEKMIEEVIRRMGRIPAGSPEDKAEEAMRGISKSPFAQWIVEEVKPKTFNAPMLDKFQGKTDPISHLLQFKQKTSLEEISEGVTCKLFATTFTDRALSWFSQLPEGSIQSFEQFGRMFLEQYKGNCPQQMTIADLHLEQRYGESTRQFLDRFTEVTEQV